MNLILFDDKEVKQPLPLSDERAQHILHVLKLNVGDRLNVGIMNGAKGFAVIRRQTSEKLEFDFVWGEEEPPLDPITLIVGLSRPHTNQKILQQATAMGVRRMLFVRTELGEGSYAASKLWTSGEYKRHLLSGAQQAFSTRLPTVEYGTPLWIAVRLVEDIPQKYALHYAADTRPLARIKPATEQGVVLAIGSERGWTKKEVEMFRRNDFTLVGLGQRILRTETAVVAALAVTKAAMGLWDKTAAFPDDLLV